MSEPILTRDELIALDVHGPPDFSIMKIVPKNKTGFRSNLHIVVRSDHEIQLLMYKRGKGDALCKTRKWFGELEDFHDDNQTPEEFEREVAKRICPRCLEMARRLMAAKKAVDGKVVRYLEDRHV